MGKSYKKDNLSSVKDKISVILPTCNRYKTVLENVKNILNQDYPDFEIIVCDDSHPTTELGKKEFLDFIEKNSKKVKYFYVAQFDKDGNKDYGLARARNTGVIESEGEFLVFLDDRITPDIPNFFQIFAGALKSKNKTWFFGQKDNANKESFVENCSAIKRYYIIDAGGFNERINQYGGQSREIIFRYAHQGFKFEYLPEAKAKQIAKSDNWEVKNKQIENTKSILMKIYRR